MRRCCTAPGGRLCVVVAIVAAMIARADEVPDIGAKRYDPNIELPESEGRELVMRACTKCHELGGLSAYKGYWGRDQWKAMIEGMVKNGAELLPAEQDTVADYLARHFGRNPVP